MRLVAYIVIVLTFALFLSTQDAAPRLLRSARPAVILVETFDGDGNILSQGSGFFLNKTGEVVTSRHVMEGARSARVRIHSGAIFSVRSIVAEDAVSDLLKIMLDYDGQELVFSEVELRKLGKFSDILDTQKVAFLKPATTLPEEGERVLVVGNPLGFEGTVSDGIVSAIRETDHFGTIIQITAPISPGSSGSPVLNMKGEAIGVATFNIVGGQGLNFAMPINRVMKMQYFKKPKTLSE